MVHQSVGGFRLSPQQRRLWQLQSAQAGQPFRACLKLRLDGPLDAARLRRALEQLVARHEILRTSFHSLPGMALPLQVIRETPPAWREVEIPDLSAAERDTAVAGLFQACCEEPFDLERGPVLRAVLAALSPACHLLLLALPALSADRRSLVSLVDELGAIYAGEGLGEQPLQYADLSDWQNELLESDDTAAGRDYWQQKSLPAFESIELPLARRSGNDGFQPRRNSLDVAPATVDALHAMADRCASPLSAVLAAAWHVLLWRLTEAAELVVGTTFEGRRYQELEGATGLFSRVLPLTVSLRSEMTFPAVVHAARDAAADLHQWQEYFSWDSLVRAGQEGGSPPFVPFGFELLELASPDPVRWRATLLESWSHTDRFAVRLSCFFSGDRLSAELQYDASRFSDEAIQLLGAQLGALLRGLAADPEQTVGAVGLLGDAERRLLLSVFNPQPSALPEELCVHRWFERWADERPGDVALSFEGEDLTFSQLNARANRLAHLLREYGVGPDQVVALRLPRSPRLIVGLLAVLKAGGAYMPLDPALPAERLALLLDEGGAAVLVTGGAADGVPTEGRRVIDLDTAEEEIQARGDRNLGSGPRGENLVYVLFTSGSTGRPKAVGIEHRQLASYVQAIRERLVSEPGWTYASVSTLSTDLGNTAVFPALCGGGRLHLISEERASDPQALAEYCRLHRIDCLKIVPSHLAALLSSPSARDLLPHRWLILGGEACRWDLVERLWDLAPECRLLNHYGPTETTVGVTTCAIEPGLAEDSVVVPLGHPLGHSRLHLLDSALCLLPIGVPGEICIGGRGLARGYLWRCELTAERFVPDPFGSEPGGRLYRTGDLARRRANGTIEFLGRIDQQLKIRGFRIEPAEIEAVLQESPAVERAAVVARSHSSGEPRLVAYVVPDREAARPVRRWLHLERQGEIDGKSTCDLPGGLRIAHLNRRETEYLYEEIFEKQSYLKHGIRVAPGDCVFDVGANIGLFSLFLATRVGKLRVYAFEPAPSAFGALRTNAALYGLDAQLFECALSSEEGREKFTFYPKLSVLSSLYADAGEEQETVAAFALSEHRDAARGDALFDALLADRLEKRDLSVQLRTLSSVVQEHGIERIDLLKIDVQKSEMDVLAGIAEADWPKIRQMVAEVHGIGDRLGHFVGILEAQGFTVQIEQTSTSAVPLYTVYAVRQPSGVDEAPAAKPSWSWSSPPDLLAELDRFARAKLPQHMIPAVFVLLDELPLTPAGKLDRSALPEPPEPHKERQEVRLPRSSVEQVLAEIWQEVLGKERISLDDDFFDLGGHSLLATQVVSRVQRTFNVDLPLRRFLDDPSLGGLATAIEELLRGSSTQAPPIRPVPRDRDLPLSFAQLRLWFIHQLDPASSAYNIFRPLRIHGDFQTPALQKTLTEIARRHEVLRTVYRPTNAEPVQVILPVERVPLPLVDLSGLPESARETVARDLARWEARRPFDLARGPLLRAFFLRLAPADHFLFFSMHHIVSDHWSTGLLIRELALLYDAFSHGRPSPLPELSVQYADYAAWQRDWLQGAALDAELAYWKSKLLPLPPPLDLPTDRPRPLVRSQRGAHLQLDFGSDLTEALRRLSRKEGATPFLVLLACFQALLHKHTGSFDFCVGSPVAGRRQLETEGLIGFFVNNLVLRTSLAPEDGFLGLVARVRESWLEADLHQEVPFEKLVEELQPERDLRHTPLFQVVFNYGIGHSTGESLPSLEGFRLELPESSAESVHFDLTLSLVQKESSFWGALEYSTDLFDRTTILRMAAHFRRLLETVAADPRQRLTDLALLGPEEREQVLREWNAAFRPSAGELRFDQLFTARAQAAPEAPAVLSSQEVMSYGELDSRSNQLARFLRGCGVGPEIVVSLLMESSPEMLVAILAVLKAGGAFLPLDPAHPDERLLFMLQDAGTAVLLTQGSLRERIAAGAFRVLSLDGSWQELAGESEEPLRECGPPESLAYVVYTSGSTGRPKGVMVTHQALARFAREMGERFGLGPRDRFLQFASPAFDVLIEEIFPVWWGGGAVVVADRRSLLSPRELIRVMAQNAVTAVELPSLFWHECVQDLASAGQGEMPRSLRLLILGSDKPSPDYLAEWGKVVGVPVVHVFGLSETTVTSTLYEVPLDHPPAEIPIGRPIGNTLVYVLDGGGQPVPVGVTGELYVGGEGVARGYFGRPALTAERFVPDPWSGEPGARLYRTGDRVRCRADGHLEFLGRMDHQVKVRGVRIELGEIESALRRHPAIRDAAVAVHALNGDRRLVAYVCPDDRYSSALAGGVNLLLAERNVELWPSHGEYPIYDRLLYSAMMHDDKRNEAYRQALRDRVPGRVALDAGTGAEAVLARLCVEAGATHVYAVERGEDAYKAAKACVDALGLADRITLLHGDVVDVPPPEKVDLCVSELIGSIGGSEGAVPILNAVRERWLKESGTMVPQRCLTYIAAVRLPDEIRDRPCFTGIAAHYAQRIREEVGPDVEMRVCIRNFPKSHIISDVQVFEDLRFDAEAKPDHTCQWELQIESDARLDGFLLWIRLYPDDAHSVDALDQECSWLPVYFPAFSPGLEVSPGDRLEMRGGSSLSDDGVHPDYWVAGVVRTRSGSEIHFEHWSPHHGRPPRVSAFHEALRGTSAMAVEAGEVTVSDLRAHLAELLPEHMIPGTFVVLDALPRTPSGKLDRRSLPAPARTVEEPAPGAATGTPTEEALAAIWAEVLNVERVGLRDSFFDLGGHSLLAIQIVARIRDTLGVEIDLFSLFEKPTVAELSEVVEAAGAGGAADPVEVEETVALLERLSDEEVQAMLGALEAEEKGFLNEQPA